jgi:integrase/recombinase XerD
VVVLTMPVTLAKTISKIQSIPNQTNAKLVEEMYEYLKSNGVSERHQHNALKVMIPFANYLGPATSFFDIKSKEQILAFLDTKKKNDEADTEKKWIATWNSYLVRIKYFFRWLYNQRGKNGDIIPWTEWQTPSFVQIKYKKTKRLSPYSETEVWDRDELLTIVKYEPHMRNKAEALGLIKRAPGEPSPPRAREHGSSNKPSWPGVRKNFITPKGRRLLKKILWA